MTDRLRPDALAEAAALPHGATASRLLTILAANQRRPGGRVRLAPHTVEMAWGIKPSAFAPAIAELIAAGLIHAGGPNWQRNRRETDPGAYYRLAPRAIP